MEILVTDPTVQSLNQEAVTTGLKIITNLNQVNHKKHFRSNNDPCRPHLGRIKLDTKKIYFSVTSSPKISSNLLRRMFASDTGNLQYFTNETH